MTWLDQGSLHRRSGVAGFRPEPVTTAYARTRDPDLPWGYWLREAPNTSGVQDADGRQWPSVRHAFFDGRLGVALPEHRLGQEQAELMIAMLSVFGRRVGTSEREAGGDVLDGADHAYRFYKGLLIGKGLGVGVDGLLGEALLTDEGHAALMMLKVTRPPELDRMAPGRAAIDLAADEREFAELVSPDIELDALTIAFAREQVGRDPAVVLVDRRAGGRGMPLAKTIWTTTFHKPLERDRFYAWLVARADRWTAWADLVGNNGAAALSERLLSTYVSSVDWGPTPQPLALEHHGAA